jgi:hypothetical protein
MLEKPRKSRGFTDGLLCGVYVYMRIDSTVKKILECFRLFSWRARCRAVCADRLRIG